MENTLLKFFSYRGLPIKIYSSESVKPGTFTAVSINEVAVNDKAYQAIRRAEKSDEIEAILKKLIKSAVEITSINLEPNK